MKKYRDRGQRSRRRKSIKRGAETGTVVLYEKVPSSREDLRVVHNVEEL